MFPIGFSLPEFSNRLAHLSIFKCLDISSFASFFLVFFSMSIFSSQHLEGKSQNLVSIEMHKNKGNKFFYALKLSE